MCPLSHKTLEGRVVPHEVNVSVVTGKHLIDVLFPTVCYGHAESDTRVGKTAKAQALDTALCRSLGRTVCSTWELTAEA